MNKNSRRENSKRLQRRKIDERDRERERDSGCEMYVMRERVRKRDEEEN